MGRALRRNGREEHRDWSWRNEIELTTETQNLDIDECRSEKKTGDHERRGETRYVDRDIVYIHHL